MNEIHTHPQSSSTVDYSVRWWNMRMHSTNSQEIRHQNPQREQELEPSKRERLRQIFTNEGRRIHTLNNIVTEEISKHFIIACKQCIGPYIVMELSVHSLVSYMEYHA
eukprot:750338_1